MWRAARASIEMPDCPPDLSEPQYASLVLEKDCQARAFVSQNERQPSTSLYDRSVVLLELRRSTFLLELDFAGAALERSEFRYRHLVSQRQLLISDT